MRGSPNCHIPRHWISTSETPSIDVSGSCGVLQSVDRNGSRWIHVCEAGPAKSASLLSTDNVFAFLFSSFYNTNMANDIIHDAVRNALTNDGWTITAEHFRLRYEEFNLFADLAAERSPIVAEREGQKILVEIKSFAGRSFVRELQQTMGQYQMYLDFMGVTLPDYELYIAVSQATYTRFFNQKAVQFLLERHKIPVIVVNVQNEVIVRWINPQNTEN